MNRAIATIEHRRGETITFGLRSTPAYDGTETVTCDVKLALNGDTVPPASAPVVLSITPSFSNAAWMFTITATQSAAMADGNYITDAKVVFAGGAVDYTDPLGIKIQGRVTT
jgi:hypothetical protein